MDVTQTGPNAPISAPIPNAPQQGGAPQTEEKATPPQGVDAKKPDADARFAALARKERMIQQRQAEVRRLQFEAQQQQDRAAAEKGQALAQQQQAQREAAYAAREARLQEFEKYREDPFEALKRLGYSYDDLTKMKMAGGKRTPDMDVRQIREEMQALKLQQQQEREQAQRQAQQAQQQQAQQAIDDFKGTISHFISKNGDKFELISKTENVEGVFSTIQEYYRRTGKIMDIEEAAQATEEYLEHYFDNLHTGSKKLSSKYSKIQAQKAAEDAMRKQGMDVPEGARGPTDDLNGVARVSGLTDNETEQARIARALAALGQ